MKTATIEAIRAKHERKLAEAIAAEEIRETLETATGHAPAQVHVYALYGRDASAQFGNTYGPANDYLTPAEVATIADLFPPLPLVLRKDGCTSFPSADYAAANPKGTDTEIAPWLLKVDTACVPQHGHAPIFAAEWLAEVAGRRVEITCQLAPHQAFRVSFQKGDNRNRAATIHRTDLEFFGGWSPSRWHSPTLHHQTAGDNIQRLDRIQWGRGSDDSGHNFTFYTGAADADLAHYLRRVSEL